MLRGGGAVYDILLTPEACQEISRGLSERKRAQPPVPAYSHSAAMSVTDVTLIRSNSGCRMM